MFCCKNWHFKFLVGAWQLRRAGYTSSCSHALVHPRSTSGAGGGGGSQSVSSHGPVGAPDGASHQLVSSALTEARTTCFGAQPREGVDVHWSQERILRKPYLIHYYVKSQNGNVFSKPQDSILQVLFRHPFRDEGSDRLTDLSEAAHQAVMG